MMPLEWVLKPLWLNMYLRIKTPLGVEKGIICKVSLYPTCRIGLIEVCKPHTFMFTLILLDTLRVHCTMEIGHSQTYNDLLVVWGWQHVASNYCWHVYCMINYWIFTNTSENSFITSNILYLNIIQIQHYLTILIGHQGSE
jgi:hypothetical protein